MSTAAAGDTPRRVEIPRIQLCRDLYGQVSARQGRQPGVTSTNQLLAGLAPGEELAVVEFQRQDRDGWFKEPAFRAALLKDYPSRFGFQGANWHLIGGTINGAGRGELLACTRCCHPRHALPPRCRLLTSCGFVCPNFWPGFTLERHRDIG